MDEIISVFCCLGHPSFGFCCLSFIVLSGYPQKPNVGWACHSLLCWLVCFACAWSANNVCQRGGVGGKSALTAHTSSTVLFCSDLA